MCISHLSLLNWANIPQFQQVAGFCFESYQNKSRYLLVLKRLVHCSRDRWKRCENSNFYEYANQN